LPASAIHSSASFQT